MKAPNKPELAGFGQKFLFQNPCGASCFSREHFGDNRRKNEQFKENAKNTF
jgi:hypothetical protein